MDQVNNSYKSFSDYHKIILLNLFSLGSYTVKHFIFVSLCFDVYHGNHSFSILFSHVYLLSFSSPPWTPLASFQWSPIASTFTAKLQPLDSSLNGNPCGSRSTNSTESLSISSLVHNRSIVLPLDDLHVGIFMNMIITSAQAYC